jgi:hypothetical protein
MVHSPHHAFGHQTLYPAVNVQAVGVKLRIEKWKEAKQPPSRSIPTEMGNPFLRSIQLRLEPLFDLLFDS